MGVGPQLATASADPLLVELCGRVSYPVALMDGAGGLVAASPLFDALLRAETDIPRALQGSVGLASSQRRVQVDLPRLVLELAPLEGTLLVRVRAFGPGVVFARLAELGGAPLSARESETLAFALDGRSNAEVAQQLGVRPETIKVHLRNAYRKLGATGRTPLLARLVA